MYKVAKIIKSSDMRKDARDWVIQTNCYRYLSGLKCDHIKILAIIKDFKYTNSYGVSSPAVVIDIPKIKISAIEKWLSNTIREVKKVLESGTYPKCTKEDTWGGIRCRDWCDVNTICEQYKRDKTCWLDD